MKKPQSKIHNVLNIIEIIDDAKCFQSVRELRWPDDVCCPHCDSNTVVKHGRDETRGDGGHILIAIPFNPLVFFDLVTQACSFFYCCPFPVIAPSPHLLVSAHR